MAKTTIEVDLRINGSDTVAQVEQKTKSLRSQLFQMKELLASGKLDSNQFAELSARAAELQNNISDVNKRVRNLATDAKGLDAFVALTQGIVGGFAAVQGITALVGDENEELQKTMVKLQGAMAAMNGLQALANALNKDSAIFTALQTVKLRVLNFVEAQRAASLQYTTVAMQRATFAARMFGAALASLGIFAVIAALVYLIPKISEWIKGSEDATKAQQDLTDAIKQTDSALESYNQNLDFTTKLEISAAKRRGESAEQLTQITINAEKKKLAALEKNYAEQGALYDKLNEGMVSGAVKMDKELLKQQGEANVKRYEAIVEQSNKIALLEDENKTKTILDQREFEKQQLEEKEKANKARRDQQKRDAAEAKKLRDEANAKEMEDLMTSLENQNAADDRAEERNKKKGEQDMADLMADLERQVEYDAAVEELNKKNRDAEIKAEQEKRDAKVSILNSYTNAAMSAGEALIGEGFKQTAAGKIIALSQIATDTALAISSLVKNSQANPANAPTSGLAGAVQFAAGIAQITANIANARRILVGGGTPSASGGGGSSVGNSQPPPIQGFIPQQRQDVKGSQRVYVLEKDITDTQGRVARIRTNATLM